MGDFNLLHPWLLTGLAGASLPVLIHLIGRKRAPSVSFAAFDFLVAVNKRLARRERLRQLLLLLLRTLAIAALVAAVARPMPLRQAAAASTNRRLALVVDTSASMGYLWQGKTLLARAKEQGRAFLSHLQPGDAITMVVAGTDVRAQSPTPSLNHSQVREALDAIDGVDGAEGVADLGTAIDKALAQLGSDGSGATLVVLSDLAQNSFDHLRPTAMDPPPEIRLVDAAERPQPGPLPNAAVEHVTVERSADSPMERRFKIVVRNHGNTPVQGRAVELAINDVVTQRGYIDIPARASAEKTLTHSFDAPGIFNAQVRLAPSDQDGYDRDDSMDVVVEVARGVRVLAVNGEPRTTPYEDELFFVQRALEAVPKGDPAIALSIVDQGELADGVADLTGFDVVILANVGGLPEAQVARLKNFVAEGGGLLFTLGNAIRFEKVNALFGDLLPHPLRDLQLAADPAAGTPAVGIGDFDWDHPILQGLGLPAEESLRAARAARYFNLDVGASVKARAILRFDNGAPALVEQRRDGKGRVMLLTTSVDLDWTDLPLRAAFPALMQRTVRYLARAVEGTAAGEIRAGGTAEVAVPTGARGLALIGPSNERTEQMVTSASSGRLHFSGLDESGIYQVEVLRQTWVRDPRLDVAVNPSLDESDFMPVRPERLSDALGAGGRAGRAVSVTIGTGQQGDPFEMRGYAPYLLLGLCLFFIGESLLASRG